MSEVFLSYRQTNEEQRQRVRAFAERLRAEEITVILDQFFLDANPAGPNDGWPKWSSDRALETEYVLIIGSPAWFDCFENKQLPGTGLGAACEAQDIRTRIYNTGGVIPNIRVVLFDDADEAHIPGKLSPYHRFHSERDFGGIVRWLKNIQVATDDTPRTSIPHNLPSLQPFFGREEELKKIADALDPESRTWGRVIDGHGGMGKTSLAVRAAYDASPENFEKIVFVSLKSRKLDEDGVRDLSVFLISGLAELLNELGRELGHADIAKAPQYDRPRMLLDALRGTRTLLVLDNLESLIKKDRDIIFTFVENLPPGCKAILTSRGRIGFGAEELTLPKLGEEAALATIEKLAESNPALARTSEAERLGLYNETGGKPLLLRWTAGQIGRGSCVTLSDAIDYLRSCPEENDPLEFIFGDLVDDFSDSETRVLCALTYFILPARVEHISIVAECERAEADRALRRLTNRSLVVPSEEPKTFTLVPLVADFLRKKKPEVVAETDDRLEKWAYALAIDNGYDNHDRFSMIEAGWPIVAAALPQFLAGANERLQDLCNSLTLFLEFTGHWDESCALAIDAEQCAVTAKDFLHAGWRAHQAGWIYYLRRQSAEVIACADRADSHWHTGLFGTREQVAALRLRGIGHQLAEDYEAAILAYSQAVALCRTLGEESRDFAIALNALADAESKHDEFDAAERDFNEALRIAREVDYLEGVAYITANLANLALNRGNSSTAETLARESLVLSEKVGRQELIAGACTLLASALIDEEKKAEARPYAQRALEIFTRLDSPDMNVARDILAECES